MSASKICALLFILGSAMTAHGYEIGTHSKISEQAIPKSNNLTSSFANLGLVSQDDILTANNLSCSGTSTQSVLNWILEGSVCEDDTFTEVFARYKHHFYDPQHNGKAFGGILKRNSGLIYGMPAPDWILDMGPADGQLYSFSQGRQYFYDAVTKPTDAERKANLARMFRSLGDVMHIMQDMAQPQHTRNDSHGLPKSNYEVYTNDLRDSLAYTGEPVPKYATAREYFTNLAKFSNNNFVSAATNFDEAANQGFSLPAQGAATDVPVHTLPDVSTEVLAECNASKPCMMTFFSTSETVSNPRASTQSILDQYLKLRKVSYPDPVTSNEYFKDRIYSLNKYTFDATHPFLIPRATAYSAGILDYFFRGNIDMVADTGNPGKYMIKNKGTEDMTGDFALYYDAVDGNRYPVPGAAWPSLTVSANSQANNLSFVPPANPAPQTPDEFTLVFNGTMGAEQAGHNSLGVANRSIGAIVARKVDLKTIVGYSSMNGGVHAYSYSGGIMTDLGTLGGTISVAQGINTAGTIVGYSRTTGDSTVHAFSYSGGVMTDLGTLGGTTSVAQGINTAGTIVGFSRRAGGAYNYAFSYSGGVMTDLGTFGGIESIALGINTAGTIVGYSYTTGNSAIHAFSYSGGVMADLGTLGGTQSYATGINTAGTIIGYSHISGNSATHAFSYSGGVMTDLGTLGGNESTALGINTAGTIVGYSQITGDSTIHAFSYSGGVMKDLGTLGGSYSYAYGVK